MKYFFVFLFCTLSYPYIFAQEIWDLRKCIQYAQDHSIQVKQAELQTDNSKLDLDQAKKSRYPDISASMTNNLSLGRSLNQTTYEFVQKAQYFNSVGLDASVLIYNGGRIKNTILQADINKNANEETVQQAKEDLALQIASAYLNILLMQESLITVKDQDKQTRAQFEQTKKLILAGTAASNATLEIEAQLARNEQNIVNAENTLEQAYFSLKQLMNIDISKQMSIQNPNLDIPEIALLPELDAVYKIALSRQPNIRASEFREKSAALGVEIAKSTGLPTISAFAGISTNYSSAAQRLGGITFDTAFLGNIITPFGDFPASTLQPSASYELNPFFNQYKENISERIGLQISVPIYSQGRTKIGIERAKLAVESAEFNTELLRIQLKSNIATAIAAARAAYKRYEAAKKSAEISEQSRANIEKRYNLGTSTSFDLNTAQNNTLFAKSELISAKYDYIFRLKILDFYQGKALSLNN